MGIYLFKASVLKEMLENSDDEDFGRQIIPKAIENRPVWAYSFDGYWADIGTIEAFYDANLELTVPIPRFNFYDERNPIFTRPRFLPSTRADGCSIQRSMLADGCLIQRSEIQNSVIGLRSVIAPDVSIHRSVTMGADWYETLEDKARNRKSGIPDMGIGSGCLIERAIIDKNARIGNGVVIRDHKGDEDSEIEGQYAIRDGVVVIEKGALIPDGTII
jgi:glucose-1-phosphate adenylyltransferase